MMKHGVVVLLALAIFSACGKKKGSDTPYAGDPSKSKFDGFDNTDPPPAPAEPNNPATPTPAPSPNQPDPNHPAQPSPPPPPQDHQTKYCYKVNPSDKNYPATDKITGGSVDGHDLGVGGGCIHRPIREVWATALNQNLMVWNDVDESSFQQFSPPPGVSFFLSVKYVVHRIITVDWGIDWYHSVKVGSLQDPQKILINYQKVRGTSHIQYWEGEIVLDRVNDHVTSFAMRNQINADQQDDKDAMSAVDDVYKKLSSGDPDWNRLNGH